MSRDRDDFEERLRRALHDAADRVEPAAGGLDRIRRSLTGPRPVLLAGMMIACATAARRAAAGLHAVMAWLPTVFAAPSDSQPGAPPGMPRRRVRAGTAVVAVLAAAVTVAGVFALTPVLRQSLPGTVLGSHSLHGGGAAGPNSPKVNGHGGRLPPGSAAGTGPGHPPPGGSSAGPAPCPATTPAAAPSASPGQTACTSQPTSPSPSHSPSPSGTPSPSQSPTPSPSVSPSPSASSSPSPTAPSAPGAAPSPSVAPLHPAGSSAGQGIFAQKTLTKWRPPRGMAHIRPGKRSRHGHNGGSKPWQGRRHHHARQPHPAGGTNRPRGLGRAISRLAGPRVHHAPHARR